MPSPVVQALQLGRRYGSVTALTGVDLTIAAGEAIALLGPNGAGKTTLLRLLATLLQPTQGSLRLFGADAKSGGPKLRRRIGLLSHQTFLYPDLSPSENLDFYARLYAVPDRDRRIRALIERTGLSGWSHRPVRTLSRGLEQRCAIARTLLHEPALLLLDEPFTGLDRGAAAILLEMVTAFRAAGGSVVMSTHDTERALTLCNRICILRRGHLHWCGDSADEIRPEFERAYENAFAQ